MIKVSEAQFMGSIIDLALLRLWLIQHSLPAISNKGWRTPVQGDTGFPDLVLARAPRLIVAEIKSDKGSASPEQRLWLSELSDCPGVEVYYWKPHDWEDIKRILW